MKNFLKVITATFFSICFCYKTYAFDLKSLTDKIQKDIGNKLQIPKGGNSSGNSNPLGGMLKNLNKNKGGGSALNLGNMSQASSLTPYTILLTRAMTTAGESTPSCGGGGGGPQSTFPRRRKYPPGC